MTYYLFFRHKRGLENFVQGDSIAWGHMDVEESVVVASSFEKARAALASNRKVRGTSIQVRHGKPRPMQCGDVAIELVNPGPKRFWTVDATGKLVALKNVDNLFWVAQ